MSPERMQQIEAIFHDACSLAPKERTAFLKQACVGDEALRREVELLLASDEQAATLIEAPAYQMAAPLLAERQPPSFAGQSISHYQVISLLGKGGMGEVYRARDTRLDRTVALKILPADVSTDAERMRRFVREAKAASALNHPHVATIYEIGEADSVRFIAMEYVEGQTLAAKINGAPLAINEVIAIGSQIADALDEAHRKGITHRDIKPANVMLTPRGQVKVLDFGLAKIARPQSLDSQMSTLAQTQAGVVMGTVPYMSPEQVRGQEIDGRSDVFSLGVVLYEMLTGRRPFEGATASDVMAAILTSEPVPASRLASVPPELEQIVNRCLAKEHEQRYPTMGEVIADLKELRREHERSHADEPGGEDKESSKTAVILPRASRWLRPAVFLSLGLLLGVAVWWIAFRHSPPSPPLRIVPFTSFPGREVQPSFSPDGNQIAFVWNGEEGDHDHIYAKQIGSEAVLALTNGPDSDHFPSWSPDGRSIAFTRRTAKGMGLYLIPSLGGAARQITEPFLYQSWMSSWSPDSESLWIEARDSEREPFNIYQVARATGEKRKLTSSPAEILGDTYPAISPNGKTVAFTRWTGFDECDLYVIPAVGGEPKRLTFDHTDIHQMAWTADGSELLFSSRRGVGCNFCLWRIPATGGTIERVEIAGQHLRSFAISRQGTRLAVADYALNANIWQLELTGTQKQSPKKLIFSTQLSSSPQYSPDGKKIAFMSNRSGNNEIWVCDSDGQHLSQLTFFNGPLTFDPRWSPDSRQIAFESIAEGNTDIYVVSVEGGQPRRRTIESSEDVAPSWSHDGQWIYFCSNRSGGLQIWKMPAAGGQAVQVTKQGGFESVESPDGQFLYYLKDRRTPGIWRVPVRGGEETLILDHHRSGLWRYWAVVEQGIYFATAEQPDHPLIEFFSFATGQITLVATLEKEIFGNGAGLAVSPDGRWLIYNQVDQVNSDIMLIENFR